MKRTKYGPPAEFQISIQPVVLDDNDNTHCFEITCALSKRAALFVGMFNDDWPDLVEQISNNLKEYGNQGQVNEVVQ